MKTSCALGAANLAKSKKPRLTLWQKITLAIIIPPWVAMMAGLEFLMHLLGIPHWH